HAKESAQPALARQHVADEREHRRRRILRSQTAAILKRLRIEPVCAHQLPGHAEWLCPAGMADVHGRQTPPFQVLLEIHASVRRNAGANGNDTASPGAEQWLREPASTVGWSWFCQTGFGEVNPKLSENVRKIGRVACRP